VECSRIGSKDRGKDCHKYKNGNQNLQEGKTALEGHMRGI
jgi:hypothetical protein